MSSYFKLGSHSRSAGACGGHGIFRVMGPFCGTHGHDTAQFVIEMSENILFFYVTNASNVRLRLGVKGLGKYSMNNILQV